jgi:hypothetical protein
MDWKNYIEQRIERVTESGCWLWTASLKSNGYGQVRMKSPRRMVTAHRLSFETFNGAIPNGQVVRHTCDVQACVNPKHLVLGSQQENVNDTMKRGRSRSHLSEGKALRGTSNGMVKLTEKQVRDIRAAAGSLATIAARFGVSRQTCSRIRRRELWAHLP